MKLYQSKINLVADTYTPVSAYLKLRDIYPNSYLLESADRHNQDNATSYLCFNPICSVWIDANYNLHQSNTVTGELTETKFSNKDEAVTAVEEIMASYSVEGGSKTDFPNGFFGMLSFEGITLFEDIDYSPDATREVPLLHYTIFENVLVFDHFSHIATLYCFSAQADRSNLEEIRETLDIKTFPSYGISIKEERIPNCEDDAYLNTVLAGKEFCRKGDVFQVVLSREFKRAYQGDEFNLYRALRSVNPSPYMFYFDIANFKLLGASPESQVKMEDNKVFIAPIAGTVPRTGQDDKDTELAVQLSKDPKEAAEHIMLVDLARNDLSKIARDVNVDKLRELHYYSHVIHLVSSVSGTLKKGISPLRVLGETFPAGTLSGAPKFRAMEIIRDLENLPRGMYGGSIGFIGLDQSINHAIFIRSVYCNEQHMHYRGGAGVVDASKPQNELMEVEHKLGAIEAAIGLANETFGS